MFVLKHHMNSLCVFFFQNCNEASLICCLESITYTLYSHNQNNSRINLFCCPFSFNNQNFSFHQFFVLFSSFGYMFCGKYKKWNWTTFSKSTTTKDTIKKYWKEQYYALIHRKFYVRNSAGKKVFYCSWMVKKTDKHHNNNK